MSMLFALAGCAPAANSARVAVNSNTASPPAAVGAYDGEWSGSGVTSDGRTIHLAFSVRSSAISAITYVFNGPDGKPCTNITYNNLLPASRPQISGQELKAAMGEDLQLTAAFPSDSSVSGSLAVVWQGRSLCNSKFTAQWQGTKASAALCGSAKCDEEGQSGAGSGAAEKGQSSTVPLPVIQLLIFGLANGAVLALNAISVTVVYGAVRTLNLAHGDVFSLTTVVVTSLLIGLNVQASWPPWALFGVLLLALGAAVGVGMLLNMALEWAAFRPFRGRSRFAPLIATLGISFMLFQAAQIWRTHQGSWIPGEHRSVPGLPEVPTDGIPNLLPSFNLVKTFGLPFTHLTFGFNDLFILLAAIACAVGTYAYLRYTVQGRAIEACMENPTLAQMIGIDLNATIRRAFAIGGLLAGVAAFIFAVYYGRPFGQNGAQSGLFAFTAAMLGGIGNPLGALASALTLGVFGSFSDYFFNAEWTPALLLVLLVGLLYLRPRGFFGEDSEDTGAGVRDALTPASLTSSSHPNRILAWILAALAVFPLFALVSDLSSQILVRGIGIFILLALGLNILLGLAGVLDLGYAAAFGIGAYAAAILTNPWGLFIGWLPHPDFTLVFLVSAGLAGLFGLLKGLLTARLRSDYLALATLALGLLIPRLAINLKSLTGGAGGISALPAPHILGLSFANPTASYYLVLGALAVAALLSQRLARSRTGRAWLAASDDEVAAGASGVDAGYYRLLGLIISSALAGAAGALYASTFAYVDPDILSFHWTAMLLSMVILGGAGSVSGAMLGAILIIGYDKIFIPWLSALLSFAWPKNLLIGSAPDLRGTSFFNFGLILYLTVLLRARAGKGKEDMLK